MNRKHFLASLVPFASVASAFTQPRVTTRPSSAQIPYLKKGDKVAITCPSGFITANECTSAIHKMEQWGFKVQIGNTIGAKDFTLAGTDQERREDMQRILDNPEVKAIMLGRGGYGAIRIIDSLDFTKFRKNPKWIIGFSDATVFHLHVYNFNIPTIHSKMCNSFPDDFSQADEVQRKTIDSIRACLMGERMSYSSEPNPNNKTGNATGKLIGGNLSLIANLCGSKSDIQTDGAILFLEDVGEYPYKIDGMLWNLKRSGKLSRLAGLIIGRFRLKSEEGDDPFGRSLYDMVHEKVKEYSYPVCFEFPVGHVKENYALKCGIPHTLKVTPVGTTLKSLQ